MKADTMNEKTIELPPPDIKFPGLCGDIVGYTVDHTRQLIECAILADRAIRSRAASEPGEVARLVEDALNALILTNARDYYYYRKTMRTLRTLIDQLAAAPLPASSPVAAEGQKAVAEPCLEVWNGDRKVTIYLGDCVLRIWGANINDEMSDASYSSQAVHDALRWLFATPTANMADAADAERFRRMAGVVRCSVKGVMLDDTSGIEQWRSAVDRIATPGPRGENAGGVVEAQAVIAELVALKDLKDATECWVRDVTTGAQWPKMPYEERMAACAEYNRRKPLAWAAARACATAWGLRIAEKGDADHA